jgi:phage terminase small subunit
LTQKQRRFVEEYLIDLNATQAAIRAGYSKDSARSIGCENLTKPDIADEIAKLRKAQSERTGVTADQVMQELTKLATPKQTRFVEEYLVDLNAFRPLPGQATAPPRQPSRGTRTS